MKRSEAGTTKSGSSGGGEIGGIGVDNLFPGGIDGPSMGPGYGRIVSRMFELDPFAEYNEMERFLDGLQTKPSEMTYPQLADELEQVENHSWRAAKLLAHAQDARDAYERDCEIQESAWKEAAGKALAAAKADGSFAKQITNGDLQAWVAGHFSAEYKAMTFRRSKVKRMVEAIERGVDLLKYRRNTLATLTEGAR